MNHYNEMQRSQVVLRFTAFSFVKIQGVLLRRAVFICLKKPLRLKLGRQTTMLHLMFA